MELISQGAGLHTCCASAHVLCWSLSDVVSSGKVSNSTACACRCMPQAEVGGPTGIVGDILDARGRDLLSQWLEAQDCPKNVCQHDKRSALPG